MNKSHKLAMAAMILALGGAAFGANAAQERASAFGAFAQEGSTYRVSIVNPADQSTVFSDTGEMTVQASVSPPLANGDSLELLVENEGAGGQSRPIASFIRNGSHRR